MEEKTEMLKKGCRISVTVYGELRTGALSRDQKSSVVFVILEDDLGRETWFHRTKRDCTGGEK